MFKRHFIVSFTVPILLSTVGLPVFAQGLTTTPSLNPGQVLQDLQQKTVPSYLRPNIDQKPGQSEIEGEPKAPNGGNNVENPERRVLIKHIDVKGVTLLDPKMIHKIVSPYENRKDSFSDFQDLADKLTALYRAEGYITSRVYLPPQQLKNNDLYFQAAEGLVGNIQIEKGRFFGPRAIRQFIGLKKGQPFQVHILSKDLKELNSNPDINVRASLRAGEEPRQTDLDLKVTDHFPIHLQPFFDNTGRSLIGVNRYGFMLGDNNVLGFGDQLLDSVSFTSRSAGLINHYAIPLGHGTQVGMDFAHSRLKLGGSFINLNVKGRATVYSPFISKIWRDTDRYQISTNLAFDIKTLDTNVLKVDYSNDRLRVLRPSITLNEFDSHGQTSLSNEVELGLGILGGTSGSGGLASRQGAGTKFFRYLGTLNRVEKMPFSTYAVLRALVQLSPDRLVSSEQFQLGGAYTVRGYREGQMTGDTGFLLSGEWRMPFFLLPPSWHLFQSHEALRNQIQLVTFLEGGALYTKDPSAGSSGDEYLMSTGFGLRAQITRFMVGRIDLGFPLIRAVPYDLKPRLHFSLQSNVF